VEEQYYADLPELPQLLEREVVYARLGLPWRQYLHFCASKASKLSTCRSTAASSLLPDSDTAWNRENCKAAVKQQ
jgi:hypothetical protein